MGKEVAFRADAAFAKPEIYEALEERGVKYAIRIPANENLHRDIEELLKRPPGRPSKKPLVEYKGFLYQAASWKTARRVVAKVEHHSGELFPRVGFIVTNLTLPGRAVVRFYNKRGTAEQWIKEGKQAVKMTRLSCHRFRSNEVRLWLTIIAYNLGNLWRRLVLPQRIGTWSLTSLQQRLVKTGGRLVKRTVLLAPVAESHTNARPLPSGTPAAAPKKTIWGKLSPGDFLRLRTLTVGRIPVCVSCTEWGIFSIGEVAAGDLQMLDGKWYVTHAGLLRLAKRNRCSGIRVQPVREFCDASTGRWVFKATLYKSPKSKGFVGYGDADPSNVSSLVRGAEMRMAETRAVNRALRKAYGIGLCSVEEIGSFPPSAKQVSGPENASALIQKNIPSNGQPRLRDRLCQLIRQYSLDPTLVKHYAADFCETENLRDATRDRVEAFIKNLAEQAVKDRPGLLCQLNSYAQPQEVKS